MKCGKYDKMILKHQLEKDNKSGGDNFGHYIKKWSLKTIPYILKSAKVHIIL
jgi:hypothetical protein